MDFGVAKGLSALYGNTGKRENSKNELAILSMIDNKRKADEKEDQLARQEQESYEAKVNEFSATLLAPDRERINEKARMLSKKVRENVQLYGGDMSKFMAGGGGQVMKDYKNSLINSTEAVSYAENKKNMDMIVKAQMDGKIINPTDLANLNHYNKYKEGPITYTGILNEIDMPNAKAYDFGTKIPAEDILDNESNYMKIYGNYVTTFPNLPPPTRAELTTFVNNQYSKEGENWQRPAAMQKAANAKAKQGKADYSNQFKTSGQIANLTNGFDRTMNSSQYKEGQYWNNAANSKLLNPLSSEAYTKYHHDYALEEKGWNDFGSGNNALGRLLSEEYSVRNARMVYQGSEMQLASAAFGIQDQDRLNFASKEINDWMPDDDSYTAAGVRVGDLSDELDKEEYKGTWRVDAVIVGAHGKTNNNGNPTGQMIMNVVEGGKPHQEQTDSWDEEVMGTDSTIQQDLFIVMANDDGDVFYRKVDMSSAQTVSNISTRMGESDDFSGAVINSAYTEQREKNAKAIVSQISEPVNKFYDRALSDTESQTSIDSELMNFSPDGNVNEKRKNLMTSFYAAFGFYGNGKGESTYAAATKANLFTDMIKKGANGIGKDYMSMLKDPNMTDQVFLGIMAKDDDPAEAKFYEAWLANYEVLSKR